MRGVQKRRILRGDSENAPPTVAHHDPGDNLVSRVMEAMGERLGSLRAEIVRIGAALGEPQPVKKKKKRKKTAKVTTAAAAAASDLQLTVPLFLPDARGEGGQSFGTRGKGGPTEGTEATHRAARSSSSLSSGRREERKKKKDASSQHPPQKATVKKGKGKARVCPAPRLATVSLIIASNFGRTYSEIMAEVRRNIDLSALEIEAARVKRTIRGSLI